MTIQEVIESTKPELNLTEVMKPVTLLGEQLGKQFADIKLGVDETFRHSGIFGRKLPHYKVICSCESG